MESIVCALQEFLFLQISFKGFVVHCQGYSGSVAVKKNHKRGPHEQLSECFFQQFGLLRYSYKTNYLKIYTISCEN